MGVTSLFKRGKSRADAGMPLGFDDWLGLYQSGNLYPLLNQSLLGDRETIESNFSGLAQGGLKGSGVVAACIFRRLQAFSAARFQYRRLSANGAGALFGTPDLQPLETPWPNGTTADLLAKAEIDVSLAGNFYLAARPNGRLKRMRPDWVDILLGSNDDEDIEAYDLDAEIVGYVYWPGGRWRCDIDDAVTLLPEEVAHFAPYPDPEASFRGMSWLTPIVQEILADRATTKHKLNYFWQGATPNMKVKFDVTDPDKFAKWVEKFREGHEGVSNSFKTLFLAAGTDAEVIGSNLRDIDFTRVQGGGEVRIAAAAGVPASLVGLAKSLEGSALNNDAKDSAVQLFGSLTCRHLWENFCGSVAHLVNVPAGAELWWDEKAIAFLKEDVKASATALQTQATAINTLFMSGFEPESCVAAIVAGDLTLLAHTGVSSIQVAAKSDTPASAQPGANEGTLTIRSEDTHGEMLDAIREIANRPVLVELPQMPKPRQSVVHRDGDGTLTVTYKDEEVEEACLNGNGTKAASSS